MLDGGEVVADALRLQPGEEKVSGWRRVVLF